MNFFCVVAIKKNTTTTTADDLTNKKKTITNIEEKKTHSATNRTGNTRLKIERLMVREVVERKKICLFQPIILIYF